jgi:hypothetical protein
MEHNTVNKLSTLLRLGMVSKNNVRRATALLQNPEKAMSNPAYRTLMQDILVDIMDRILNSKALYTAVRQNLVREPMITTEGVEEDRTKNLLRSGLVPKKDIMVARRALSSPAKAKSMATVRAYRELMIDLLDSMVGKITGSPTLYNAFKQTMGKQKVEDMEESFEQPNENTIAEMLLHETAQELMEKNKPTKPDLWAQAKSKAKSKFKVYPSAYANGWAVKWYNEQGGGWKSVDEGKNFFGLQAELDEAKWEGSPAQAALKKAKADYEAHAAEIRKSVPPSRGSTHPLARQDKKSGKMYWAADRRKKAGSGSKRASDADYRTAINESEYKEVLTGYPNRGMNTDHGATDHRSTEFITQVNAVLKAIGRYTFHSPSEAFLRIKTRLNLLMLDFPWTPYAWQDGGTGTTVLTVTRYGRVDGVDASTGQIRMDGRAAPTDGFLEFNLVAQTEMADDGFYRVTARLEPKSEIGLPLAMEEETGSTQMNRKSPAQNEAARKRAREWRFKLESLKGKSLKKEANLGEAKPVKEEIEGVEEGYGNPFTPQVPGTFAAPNLKGGLKPGDKVKVPHKGKMKPVPVQQAKQAMGVKEELIGGQKRLDVNKNKKLDAQDFKLLRAKKKPVQEEWKSLKKTKADLNALRASGKRVTVQHGEGDTLYRVSKPKKKPVQKAPTPKAKKKQSGSY